MKRAVAVVLAVLAVGLVGVVPDAGAVVRRTREPTIGPLISGTTSIVHGTHVWTDYAYDDRGADAGAEPTYPDAAAPGNAADLIQVQLRADPGGLGIRAVLETLTDPAVPSIGVGLDLDGDPATGAAGVPVGGWVVAGTALGLERFVVVDGGGARVLAWDGASWVPAGDAAALVDPATNVVGTSVPWAALGAHGERWRVVALAATTIDGTIRDLAYVRDTSRTNFQSNAQAAILAGAADAAGAVAFVDLGALAGPDLLAAPESGTKNTFLYRSALDLGEGIRAVSPLADDNRKYAGPYQPYAVWFPVDLPPHPPLVVFLHGALSDHLSGSYGEDAEFVPGLGALGLATGVIAPDAVVVTPLARSETPLGMDGPAEQDVLDVIADVSRRFDVDQDRVVLSGYSLGGVGTFRLAQLYPDRWAGAVEIVGAPDLGALTVLEEAQGRQTLPNQLENLRNLPFRMAHSRLDELELLVGVVQPDLAALELQRLGYDYRYWQFARRDHVSFPVDAVECEIDAAIERGRVRDPARVVFSQEPAIVTDDPAIGLHLRHDRAYWMSAMVVRGDPFEPGDEGTADITSLARADRAPAVGPILGAGQNVTTGRDVCGPNPTVHDGDVWTTIGQAWSPGVPQPVVNGLAATLTRVASVTVDITRMSVDASRPVTVQLTSDGDTHLRVAAPWTGTLLVARDGARPTVACATAGVLDLAAGRGSTTIVVTPVGARCG